MKVLNKLLSPSKVSLEDFEKHYIENKDYVRNLVYWLVRETDIDDLVQDIFIKAFRAYRKFENKSSFRTWIHRIAKNTCYDFLKSKKYFNEELQQEKSQNENYELKDLITKALKTLSFSQREVFILHYKLGYTAEEISLIADIKLGTVKSRLFSAKEKFKSFMKESGVRHER